MSLEVRCQSGRPCVEVADRLIAADKAQYILGDVDAARQLRQSAARWAELHHHGAPPAELEEAS